MVYENFYHLEREPFSLCPDPAFLYLAPDHAEALAQLLYTVRSRKGFAVLTGEVGTGKTTLLRSLLGSVGSEVRTAYVLSPPRSRRELYTALASEFGLQLDGAGTWSVTLQRFLLDAYQRNVTVVAVFDEAQELPAKVLEEIRLLTNLETANVKLLQVILAGQPELDNLLDSSELRALRQRIVLRHSLSPLRAGETIQYIAKRMQVAGAGVLPFDLDACLAIHRYARGIPRLINLLCDNSLLTGYAANKAMIDSQIVDSVARDARLTAADSPSGDAQRTEPIELMEPVARRRYTMAIAGIAAAAALAMSLAAFSPSYHEQLRTLVDEVESVISAAVDRAAAWAGNSLGQAGPEMINRSAPGTSSSGTRTGASGL